MSDLGYQRSLTFFFAGEDKTSVDSPGMLWFCFSITKAVIQGNIIELFWNWKLSSSACKHIHSWWTHLTNTAFKLLNVHSKLHYIVIDIITVLLTCVLLSCHKFAICCIVISSCSLWSCFFFFQRIKYNICGNN